MSIVVILPGFSFCFFFVCFLERMSFCLFFNQVYLFSLARLSSHTHTKKKQTSTKTEAQISSAIKTLFNYLLPSQCVLAIMNNSIILMQPKASQQPVRCSNLCAILANEIVAILLEGRSSCLSAIYKLNQTERRLHDHKSLLL